MILGTAFWRKDEDSQNLHLRFIISEPNIDGLVLVVSMSTLRGNGREDTSCILDCVDHPAVKARSLIRYDKAFEINYFKLLQEKTRGDLALAPSVNLAVLKRIQEGAR